MLELKPDSLADKQRKRRSSRTGGLSSKDQYANHFLFRTIAEEKNNIYDWQEAIQPLLTTSVEEEVMEDSPMSPMSPVFNFTNPFAARTNTANKQSQQTPYSNAPPPRPSAMISPSPSLRSRRSDLSSQASSQHPPMGFTQQHAQAYPTTLPSDLPSPASTTGYETQFIEGWTSAQGRSSALSFHTRGSNSIASAISPITANASTPPGPRETILDRAFQMRCIPGSERLPTGEQDDKISSIARFEALMREHDARKATQADVKQSWELEEESEDSDNGEPANDDEADQLEMSDQDELSGPTPAQRALDYISGRRTPLASNSRPLSPPPRSPPIPFLNHQAMNAFHGHTQHAGLRPRTGTTSSRTGGSRPASFAMPSKSISTSTIPSLKDYASGLASRERERDSTIEEKRRSRESVKRLSFQEFAKRLSSTSSLLLVQTNATTSSSSGRGSSEFGDAGPEDLSAQHRRGTVADVSTGLSGREREQVSERERDKRCGWRGSVGAFGVEGGFV